jgi:hypothetical protein
VINSPYIVDGADLCRCGKRRGLHRYGDEACPNRLWTCGNGQPQWLSIVFQEGPQMVANPFTDILGIGQSESAANKHGY